jgi:hypothetical protein
MLCIFYAIQVLNSLKMSHPFFMLFNFEIGKSMGTQFGVMTQINAGKYTYLKWNCVVTPFKRMTLSLPSNYIT